MWMKIDDGLHNHRKTRIVTKSHPDKRRDAAPMGLWVCAGSWAAQNGRDGWVPEDELDRWDDDWKSLADRLVRAGYWWPHELDGDPGYGFTDWHDYNDPADLASKSGTYGNHVRWHVNEGKVDPECDHCPKEPDLDPFVSGGDREAIAPDIAPDSGGESRKVSPPIALPEPKPLPEPDPNPNPVSSVPAKRDEGRADVERICQHLASRVEANGSKRPTIGARWRTAARLMLDNDKRSEDEVHKAIDWSQTDEFWRTVVMSLPKLREKFDQMRLQAQRGSPATKPKRQQETDDLFNRAAQRMGVQQ